MPEISAPPGSQGLSLVHVNDRPRAQQSGRVPSVVSFNRQELGALLNLYGRKVATGEWRDYAMDMLRDRALFSVYRRTSERPLYVIEKNPRLQRKQGQWVITNSEGRVLKRGHKLDQVLRVLEPGFVVIK